MHSKSDIDRTGAKGLSFTIPACCNALNNAPSGDVKPESSFESQTLKFRVLYWARFMLATLMYNVICGSTL